MGVVSRSYRLSCIGRIRACVGEDTPSSLSCGETGLEAWPKYHSETEIGWKYPFE